MNSNDIINALQNNGFNTVVRKPAATDIQKDRPFYDDVKNSEIEYNSNINAVFAQKKATILTDNTIVVNDTQLDSQIDLKIFINGLFWGDFTIQEDANNNKILIIINNLPYDLSIGDDVEVHGYFKK